jgi:hypothetical protein
MRTDEIPFPTTGKGAVSGYAQLAKLRPVPVPAGVR